MNSHDQGLVSMTIALGTAIVAIVVHPAAIIPGLAIFYAWCKVINCN
jgi:hypothetical protein